MDLVRLPRPYSWAEHLLFAQLRILNLLFKFALKRSETVRNVTYILSDLLLTVPNTILQIA
jgi:hypothetical protein